MLRIWWLKRILFLLVAFFSVIVIVKQVSLTKKSSLSTKIDVVEFTSQKINPLQKVGICSKVVKCQNRLSVIMVSESQTGAPVICLNNERIFNEMNLAKGLNFVVYDSNKNKIVKTHYLSVLDGDRRIIEALVTIQNDQIIIGTSYGDVANKFSVEVRQLLNVFGIATDKFREDHSILFIAQIGLKNFEIFENVVSLHVVEPLVSMYCVSLPMGRVSNITLKIPRAHHIDEDVLSQLSIVKGRKLNVNFGSELLNCGLAQSCEPGHIPMFFYSGKDKNDAPQICVNGKYVFDRNLNGAGRGFNLVVIDSKTQQVMRTGHFDTYEKSSDDLVVFLEQLSQGELVAVVSFDEASNRLSEIAKHIFYELGSSLINRIKFRASWYLIGQKGIYGYSPFEDMNLPTGNDWAKPINVALCVPLMLSNLKTMKVQKNMFRRRFCARYDGYDDFCNETRLDEILSPKPFQNQSLSSNSAYSIPILLAGGLNKNNIRLCLESIYDQEGVNPLNIVVAFDANYIEVADLAVLFHARSMPINDSKSYNDLVLKGLMRMMVLYPSSPCIIVIKEDVILHKDFLYFIAQLMPQFLKDESANVILAGNDLGNRIGNTSKVYRIENGFASKAFVIKRDAYVIYIKNNEASCCDNQNGIWHMPGVSYMPDTSRVSCIASNLSNHLNVLSDAVIQQDNTITRSENEIIDNDLMENEYDKKLFILLFEAEQMRFENDFQCKNNSFLQGRTLVVLHSKEADIMSQLCKCYGFSCQEKCTLSSYKGVLRFSNNGSMIFFLSEDSLFVQKISTS